MDVPILKATVRTETGSKAMKELRKNREFIPGVLYGKGKDNVYLTATEVDIYKLMMSKQTLVQLVIDGAKSAEYAMFKEAQWDTWGEYLQHFDLLRVSLKDKVETNVDIILKNADTAPGVKAGGTIELLKNKVALECPADEIPESIVVDAGNINTGERCTVADLPLHDNFTLVDNPENLVFICHAPKGEEEIEADAQVQDAMQKEPEVLKEKEADDEA